MNKLYQRINWQNYPSDSTPLNESNLNKMDAAVDGIDDRVVTLDATKLPVSTANTMVKDVTFNETTGVFTITKLNGTKVTVNTALEKIATNFRFDHSTQKLILTLIDGTTQEVDLSALLTQYEFLNSSTIQFTIDSSGKVKASVVNGSITGDMLEPNYLANVTLQASKADTSAKNAKESEEKAAEYAESAKNSADSAEPVASTATGTNPTIQDSTNAPLIYGKFKGYTEQMQYSGKNLYNISDKLSNIAYFSSTAKIDEDGWVTDTIDNSSGTSVKFVNYWTAVSNLLLSNTDYLVIIENNSSNCNVSVISASTDIRGQFVTEFVTNATGITGEVCRTRETFDGCTSLLRTFVIVSAGVKATVKFRISVVADTSLNVNDFVYEPYVGGAASPNPDYPQEINGLAKDGAIEVKTTGKNLLKNTATTKTINGVTFTVNDDKSITANGTATAEVIIGVGNFKPKPNKTYIFTSNSKTLSNSEYWRAYSYIANIDGVNAWRSDSPSNNYSYEFTPLTDTTIYNNIYIESGMTVNNLKFYPMIRPVEITDDTYEPYQGENTATIPTDAPLYEGDYLEVYADGSGRLVRAMAEVVFDGSDDEEWRKSVEGTIYYAILNDAKYSGSDGNVNNVRGLCSHFTMLDSYSNAIIKGYGYCGFGAVLSLSKTMIGMNSSLTTVNEWKTWLQSNPVTVVYELATPTETPLTAEQVAEFKKLYTFEPVTNVLCDGEVEIRYYKANVNGETVGMLQEQTKDFAKKTIYGDTTINVGRKEGSFVGDCSTAEGYGTTASGDYAHAEGMGTTASGDYSHAEGKNTTASGLDSHSEGYGTTASGDYSHAEGMGTTASGDYSHAEGMGTTASGLYSHVEGNGTIAHGNSQHVQGKYNVEDTEDKYAHIVGGGTYKERKNIHTLDWDGNAEFAGNVLGHVNGNSVSLSNITRYLGRIDLGMYATQNTYDFTSFAGYDRYTLVFKGKDANRSLYTRELLTIHNIEKNTSNVGKVCLNISNNYTFEPWVEMYPSGNKTYIVVGITDTTGLTTLVSGLFVEVYGAMD